MLSTRCHFAVLLFAAFSVSLTAFAQAPGSDASADDFYVHHKHASINQGEEHHFGSTVAMHEDVLVAADDLENVEVLRRNGDGTWSFEALIAPPATGIDFGARHAIATNGEWLAIGAAGDDTFGTNAGAVHLYKFDGTDWQYESALSHMAPHGNIGYDGFGKAVSMEDGRMVVGSNAENSEGGKGAIHYFEYNEWLDMWLETGFIPSEGTANGNVTRFASSLDISGEWMIVGEYGDNTEGALAGAAYIYHWVNQCWHLDITFYGHEAGDRLGTDVSISGLRAVAGSPQAGLNGLSSSGAVTLYEYTEFSGDEFFWSETFHFIPDAVQSWDKFGTAVDLDGDLLAVGAPTDDNNGSNAGLGYFLFDCSTASLECVAEGSACDAEPNDRFGYDVAVSNGLAAIGAERDDNIFDEAGSVYVLGADDLGFECDLTAPGAPTVDLVDENDTGALNDDDITRHTTPDFDIFLPGGGTLALMNGMMAGAGDALVWTLDGTTESEMVILTQDDIDNGYVTMQFVYPGPVLPDGEYTFCSYIIDIFGNTGDTGCLTVTIDNEDPEPAFENGAEYDTSNTDTYGAYLPGASDPADCEALAAAAGGTWAGVINDAEANMVTPGCYITGGTPFQASTYEWQALATLLPDTTLYLDAAGSASLDLSSADNITATDNIAMDTLFAEPITFDCDDAGTLVPVTVTAIDIAGNINTIMVQVEVLDDATPNMLASDYTLELDASGSGTLTTADIDNGSSDNCSITSLSLSQTAFDCSHVGANSVTLTATDPSGNASSTTVTVTVEDNIAPIASASDTTLYLDATGEVTLDFSEIAGNSSDACGIASDEALQAGPVAPLMPVAGQLLVPGNDDCANATAVGEGTFAFDNTDASTDGPTDRDPNMSLDVWYLYTPSADGTASINTCGSPGTLDDTVIIVYDGSSCPSAGDIGLTSDDDGCTSPNFASTVDLAVSASNTYLIQLGGWNGAQGNGELYIELEADPTNPTGPANDDCADATAVGEGTHAFDNTGASTDGPTDADSNMADDVWFLYTPSADGTATIHTCGSPGSNDDTVIIVYDGSSCPSAGDAGLASDDDGCTSPNFNSTLDLEVSASNTYLIQLGGWNGVQGDGELYIELESGPTGPTGPANDECANATAVGEGTHAFDNTGANTDGPTSYDPNMSLDVWFLYTPSADGTATIHTCGSPGSNDDTVIIVYDGSSCPSATDIALATDDDGCSSPNFNSTLDLEVSASNTYLIQLGGWNGVQGDGELYIELTAPAETWNFTCSDVGVTPFEYIATDVNGNESTDPFSVTVLDTISPNVITQAVTLTLDASGNATLAAAQVDNGSSDACGIIDVSLSQTAFDCSHLGSNTVTMTVTDTNGNSASADATIAVVDAESPVAIAQDLTVQLDASGAATITADDIDNGSYDDCSGVASITLDETTFDCTDVGAPITVTLTVTDASGNTADATATVTVEDNVAPTALVQDLTLQLDAAGAATATAADIDNGSSDACGIASLAISQENFDCSDLGTNSLVFTAADVNGNTTTATFTVTVQDNEAPAISGTPADISQTNDAGDCGAIISWTAPTASDNCSATLTSDYSSGDSFPVGATLVTYTAVDPAGNTTTSSFTVTVTDDEDPTITGLADINQTADAGQCGAVVSWTAPSIEDNCGVDATTNSHNSGDTFPVGSTVVTYTATDAAGNGETVTFTVTITDDEDPAITGMPADITLDNEDGLCSAVATWTAPAATDNCGMDTFTSSHNSGDTFSVGSTTVTYTATDIHGNDSIASFTVTVIDAEAPVIGFIYTEDFEGETPYDANDLCATDNIYTPDDANWSLGPACTVPTNGIPKLVDVAGDTFLEYNQKYPTNSEVWNSASIDVAGMGEVTVSFDARSVGGLESFGPWADDFALYAVLDGVEQATPIVSFNGHVDGTGDSPGDNSRMEEASFSETVALGGASGLSLRIRVTISGTDGSESYQVDDMLIHYVPGNMTASNDAGVCGAVVTWTAPVASDNCGMTLTSSHDSGDTFAVGTTTVIYTATDDAGNTDETSFDITVTDDENPTVDNTPADISVNTDSGICGAVVNWTAPTAGDNCTGATIAQTGGDASGSTFAVGTHTIEYTATDAAGNMATDSFTITVTDNENPAISGMPADITQTNDAGDCGALVSWTAPTASDNCTVTSFTSDHDSGDSFAVGTTTVTYTAMDAAGNTSTGSFTVTVTDDEAPAIADMPADISQSNDAGDCSALVSWTAPTSSDNCGVTSFTSSHDSGDSFAVGTTTVTYTAMDEAGNTTTSSFTVTVTDDEDPTVDNTPADISVDNDAGACGALVTWTAPTTSDNCAGATIARTGGDASGSSFAVGTHTIEYTATDAAGNTATDSFTITVTDNEDPSISGMPADINQTADAGLCSAVVTWVDPTAGDNCAVATFTSSHGSGDAFAVGTTTVTYTATDVNGNVSTSSFDIVVTDDEDPAISGTPADISQTNDAGECMAAVTWTEPTAGDNCGIATFTSSHNPGDEFAVGTTTVTYTATDIHGNISTDSFDIEVTDDEAPTISGMPANISQSNDAGECAADVSWAAPTAGDNCGVASFTSSHNIGDSFAVGTTTVTYNVTDIHGNSNSASFTVTVIDDEAPAISPMAADNTYQRDGGEAAAFSSWLANYGGAAATDNCGIDSWSNNSTGLSDGCGSTGTETVTFTVTDIHGNSSTTSATFTVIDDYAPSCPAIDLVESSDNGVDSEDNITNDDTPTMHVVFTGSGVESAEAGDIVELYIDGALSQTHTVTQTDVDNGYAEFETGPFADGAVGFSALHIDDCGQSSIFAFLNIIVHSTDPTAMGAGMTITLDENGEASIEAEDLDDGSDDDFNIIDLEIDQTDFDCSHLGDNAVTLTVTDIAGNTATTTVTVTVVDDIDPVVTPMDITVQLDAAGEATITASDVASAEDNCTVASMTLDITSFDCSNVGDVTVTISATDQSGNSSSATATVTVEDNVPPTVMLIDTVLYLDSDGLATLAGEDLDDGSSDACGIAGFAIGVPGTEASAGQMLLVPGNDDCANATAVGEGTFAFDNTDASTDGPTDRDPNMSLDVWYLYTPSADGTASINTCGSPGTLDDTVIIVYDGSSCPSAGDIGLTSDDDGCTSPNFASTVDLAVSASNTYLIQLGGWNGAQGNGELYIELEADPTNPTGPANDDCADATAVGEGTHAFDNTGASTDGPTDADSNMADDVWFLYTPSADGTATIHTCGSPGSNDDTVIIVYDGSSCPSAGDAGLASDDDGCTSPNFNSTLDLEVSASNTYLIQLGGWNGVQGDGELYIELESGPTGPTGPANDECANATAVGEGTHAFDNTGASTDGPTDGDSNMANDVWFLYTPSGDGMATIHTCGSPGTLDDTVIILYDGASCPSAGDTGLASDDDGCTSPNFNSTLDFEVSASNTYLIQLGGWNGAQGDGELYIELAPIAPDNDECANATAVGEGTFAFDNTGANTDGPTDGDGNMANDVWFLYTPTADGTATIHTCGSPGTLDDTVIILYDGSSCPGVGNAGLASDDDGCSSPIFNSSITLEVSASNSYLIQLGGWNGAQGDGELYIDLEVPMPTLFIPEYTFDCDDTGNNLMFVEVEDVHGNAGYGMINIAVYDTTAPMVNIFDLEDYTLYAGETCVDEVDLFAAGQPWYEADDNCEQDVEILYDIINETGIAGCREFDRRWIIQSTDASGNMSSDTTLQHITVMDTTAPTLFLDGVPADLSIDLAADCTGDMPAAASVTASATDNCTDEPTLSAVTMTDSAPEYLCGDAGSYTVTRTYSATAEDACGNTGTISVEQVVTFLDVTAPQITDSEGIANGETVSETDADDIFAFIDVPSPIDLDAEDACGGDVTIVETETFSGFVPTEEIGNYCGAATPAAFLDGDACNGDAPAAIVLEGAYFGGESFTIVEDGVNIVESFYDQTLRIEVEVTNADGTGGFIWNADYNEAYNWAEWNGLGRGYKKDCPNVLPGQSPWTGWDYFVMQTGGMIGTGIYAGSELSLTHQPMNYYYGLQVGLGANNQNAKYGASAWFFWSGQLVVNGASQGFLASSGDIMLDLDCTMPWSAEYGYTVSDACGNTTSFSYTVEGDESNAGGAYVSGEESGHQPYDISVIGDLKDPIRVTGLMPNPTNDVSQLGFVVSSNMRLRVDLYSMDGQLVQELYDGNAMTDVEYLMTIDADGLDAGMYQIRIASSTYMAVKKLLVTQ